MQIKVQKQVEETVEVKTPCYYKTMVGYQHINERGQIVTVYTSMIAISEPSKDRHYTDDIQRMLKHGQSCEKEEFEYAYNQALINFNKAVLGPGLSATALITEAEAAVTLGEMAG
jgi:hypothetical protein